jgi:sugar lactone lactonase YvrE
MKDLFSKLIITFLFTLFLFTNNTHHCQSNNFQLTEIAYSEYKWTGVAVSQEGRIFVNFPRWSTIPYSVCELLDSQLVKYPNDEWNTWTGSTPPENHFVCVQSVYIDDEDFLWILDPANIGGNVVEGGAKLLKVNLETDSIIQIIYFDSSIASGGSYLNDVRVDTDRDFAYITDSGIGAIIVVDLVSGMSRKLLDLHYSTKAEFTTLVINGQTINFEIHSDGLALSSDRNYLYYKALTANSLYRIETEKLRDTTLTNNEVENAVEYVLETLPCDAIEFHPDGNLFFTAIEENAIYYLTPALEFEIAITDSRLKWPDSFSITSNGEIYVTTSRIYFPPGLHGLFKITYSSTDVGQLKNNVPDEFNLLQNYPNPFNPITTIKYDIPERSFASLKSYNILGNEIKTLVNEEKPAATYKVGFDGTNLPSGIYLYTFKAGDFAETKKMILLK